MSEELKKKLEEAVRNSIATAVQEKMAPFQGLSTKVESLEKMIAEKAIAHPIHHPSSGKIVDYGYLQQVGDSLYRLPQGSIINTSFYNINQKGLRRVGSGLFEHPGETMLEFASNLRNAVRNGQDIKFICKEPNLDLVIKDAAITDAIRAADDSSAGLFVPEDIRYALLQIAPPGTVVWPRAQVWPMTTEKISWPKLVQDPDNNSWFGGVQVYWAEEAQTLVNTKPEFTMMSLEAHQIAAMCPVTDQLLADSAINIGNLLVQMFQGAYWHVTDRSFFQGLGATQPMGLLQTPNVPAISRVTAGRVGYKDLLNMSTQLPPMYDANACFFMKKECFNALRKETDSQGRPVIDLSAGYNVFSEGVAGYAAGYPIVMSDYKTSDMGEKGDVVLGDMKHYFVGERKSVSVEMSRHYYFNQVMTAFRCVARVGGTVEQEKAFVLLDSTADPENMS